METSMDIILLTNLYHLSVGGRDFLPKLWGCFKFSSFTELVQRLMTCWLLFHLFDIFEGQVGLFLCGRTPCAITMPDMSPGFSLCTKPLLPLLVLQHFAFQTFWEFELDNSQYLLMNHNKLDSSSAGVSRFGAGADGIMYLVGLQSSVFISWRVALSPPCGVLNIVMQNSGIGIQVLATDEHLKKLIDPKEFSAGL